MGRRRRSLTRSTLDVWSLSTHYIIREIRLHSPTATVHNPQTILTHRLHATLPYGVYFTAPPCVLSCACINNALFSQMHSTSGLFGPALWAATIPSACDWSVFAVVTVDPSLGPNPGSAQRMPAQRNLGEEPGGKTGGQWRLRARLLGLWRPSSGQIACCYRRP